MLRKLVLGFLVFSLAVLFQGCESPTEPDTTPPTVTFVAGDVEGDGPFEFCATVTDEENAIASVLFSVGDCIFVGVAGDGGEYCASVSSVCFVDGVNTMLVTAEDAEGNSRTVAASFDYDSCPDETDPVISFAPGDLADAGPFTLTATVTDDSALASVTLTLNNETYAGNADGDVYSFTVSASGLFEGANSGIVTAVDACGNDASVTASFNYDACSDNEDPVISFTPGDLADAGPFTLTATVTDAGDLSSVTLTLNNETYAGNADGDVYSFTVSASGLFEGANSGIVTAVDACGNDASVTASFNYDACSDNEDPVISFTPGDLADAGPFTLTATVTDGRSIIGVSLYLNGDTYEGFPDGDDYLFTILASSLSEGENTAYVSAEDECGNESTASASFTYDACSDNEAPVISFTAADQIGLPDFDFVATVDDAGATEAWLSIGLCSYQGIEGPAGTFNFTVDALDCIVEGENTATITATDACGNEATASDTFTYSDPGYSITITGPSSGDILCGVVSFTVDADWDRDLPSVERVNFTIDGVLFCYDTDGSDGYSCDYDVSDLEGGGHIFGACAVFDNGDEACALPVTWVKSCDPVVHLNDPVIVGDDEDLTCTVSAIAYDDNANPPEALTYSWSSSDSGAVITTDGGDEEGFGSAFSFATIVFADSYGSYAIFCTVTDEYGQSSTSEATVVFLDVIAPEGTWLSPAGGDLVGDQATIDLIVEASDRSGEAAEVASVEFFANGTSLGLGTEDAGEWSLSWDGNGFGGGNYTLSAIVTDSAVGVPNTTELAGVTVLKSDTPEPVALDGEILSAYEKVVTADYTDDNSASTYLVEWDLDYDGITFDADYNGETVTLDYTALGDGNYAPAYRVTETTNLGHILNASDPVSWAYTVDTTDPQITSFDVADDGGGLVSGSSEVSFSYEDATSGIATAELSYSGSGGVDSGVFVFDVDTASPFVWDLSVAPFSTDPAQDWTIALTVTDQAGYSATLFEIVKKSDPPIVALADISSSEAHDGVNGSAVSITGWDATDDNGITSIDWDISEVGGAVDGDFAEASSTVDFSWFFDGYGVYQFQARVTDTTGKVTDSNVATLTLTDVTAPGAPTITAPLDGTTFEESVTFEVSVPDDRDSGPDNAFVTYFVDGDSLTTVAAAPWTYVWNTDGMSCGDYLITVSVTDVNGNESAPSAAITVNKSVPPTGAAFSDAVYVAVGQVASVAVSIEDYCGLGATYDYDLDGDGIYEVTGGEAEASLDYSALGPGVYYPVVHAFNEGGVTEASTVVIVDDSVDPIVDPLLDPGVPQNGTQIYSATASDDKVLFSMDMILTEDASGDTLATASWQNDDFTVMAWTEDFEVVWDSDWNHGAYTLTVTATDYTGLTGSASLALLKSDYPVGGVYNETQYNNWVIAGVGDWQVPVTSTSTDDGAIVSWEWDHDYDGVVFDSEELGESAVLDFYSGADPDGYGTYTVALRLLDDSGLETIHTFPVILVDGTNPGVVWNQVPVDGDILSGVETLSVEVDNPERGDLPEVVSVEYFANDVSLGVSAASPNFDLDVDFSAYDGGEIALKALASDQAGNSSEAATITVYKSDAPLVTLPADWGMFVPGTYDLDFTGYVSDDSESLWINVDWGDGSPLEDLGEDVFTGSHEYLADGTYTIILVVSDEYSGLGTAPNVGETGTGSTSITIDGTPPTGDWAMPMNGALCQSGVLNLSLSNLDDNEGVGNIAQVDFLASTDGLAYEDTLLVSTDNPGDGSWLGSWDTTDYPAGDYYLGARVYDSMGNELSIALDASVMISKNAEAVIDSITVQSGYGEMSSPTDFWTVAAIDALTFTAFFSDDGSAVTESWDFDGDLAVDSNANSDTWDYSVAGDFTVSYTVTEDDACWTPSQSLTAHVIADEDPEISNLAVDNVDPVTFEVTDSTATVSFDVEDSWYWSTGTIEAVNTATAEIIFSDSFESAEVPSSFSAPVAGAESFSFDFSLAGLAGGSTILVTVEVLDENGNSNAFGSGVTGFTVADEMDPALDDWLYPVPGQIIDSSVETVITVEISTLDFHDGVSSVEFYWHDMGWPLPNDAPFAVDADGSDGWTAEQNLTGMGGLTRIGVIIEDTSGNRSDYTVMEFCIDNCDPYQD